MKRHRFAIVALLLLALFLVTPLPGEAVTNIYSPFGNLQRGDCAYAAMANLELHAFTSAHITTKMVIRAYNQGHDLGYNVFPYMMSTGFDGHTIDAITSGPIFTKAQIITGVAGGGVWSTLSDGSHAVAVIGADRRYITIVDDGIIEHWSWGNFWYWQGGNVLMYAVQWSTSLAVS